jgi:hypothetical protein
LTPTGHSIGVDEDCDVQDIAEEMAVMRELPERRMESAKRERVKVDSGSRGGDLEMDFLLPAQTVPALKDTGELRHLDHVYAHSDAWCVLQD